MGENMKPSGIAWIGDIPESWEVSKVKFDFVVVNGSTPDSSDYDCWDGQIKWITPADMNETGIIDSGDRSITEFGYNSCGTTLLPKGSIVISSRAPIGKINITTEVLCTNQGCKGLVAKRDNRFTYYLMLAGHNELTLLGRGTTFLELSTYDLTNFKIVIPPLHEQTHIADFLDEQCEKIDNIATDIEKQIEILQKYKKSLITERTYSNSLDWVKTKIKYIGEIRGRIGFRGYTVEDTVDPDTEGCAVVLGGTNIMKDGTTNYEDLTFLSEMKYFESPEIMLIGGEILITKVGAGTGENSMYDGRFERATINPNIMLYLPKDNINSKFINYVLLSNRIKDDMKVESTKSGAQPAINQGYINNLEVIIPPYDKQTQIANYLDVQCSKIDAIIESKKEQLTKITQHKKSLIYEYVTGKKRVKGENNNGN